MNVRTLLRWTARALAGLVAVLVVALIAVYAISEWRMRAHFDVPEHPFAIRRDSAAVAEGHRIATIRGCVDCHGSDLAGTVMVDDPVLGRLIPANLTLGGRGAALDDRDWERAVRHGVRRDGTPLLIMPAHEMSGMSDADLGAIVAFARSLPAVATVRPATRAGPLIRVLHLARQVTLLPAEEIDHAKPHPAMVAAEPTPRFGAYLAAGCIGCHGPTLSGGSIPGAPPDWKPAANITPAGIGRYAEADFIRALREGRRPDGSSLDPQMPYRLTKSMTDVELRALYAYLRTVPAREYGNR
jgi:mono/diheme cytochrome c family protein